MIRFKFIAKEEFPSSVPANQPEIYQDNNDIDINSFYS